MIKFASVTFVLVFAAMLLGILFLLTFLLVNFLVKIIRVWRPDFCVYRSAGYVRDETTVNVKKVALDFMMERRRQIIRNLHEQSRIDPVALSNAAKDAATGTEWDLTRLLRAATPRMTTYAVESKRTEDKAEYCLIRYFALPNGQSFPRYLCTKLSQRGKGLRVAFASLPERRIKLDYLSALRLAEAIGPDTLLAPANAAARVTMKRKEQKEQRHATA
jgi:hypothetical protein